MMMINSKDSNISLPLAQFASISFCVAVLRAALEFKDITDALAFYGVYHREPLNQLIHFFGVPLFIWSVFIILAHVPLFPMVQISLPGAPQHCVTFATITAMGYIIFYLKIDPKCGGILYAPFVYLKYVIAVHLVEADRCQQKMIHSKKSDNKTVINESFSYTGQVFKKALILNILVLYIQIHPGHKIIEGAAPAIMKSFGGAFTSAPLFAFYEGLWYLGINLPLKEQTKLLVDQYTEHLCTNTAVIMRACADCQS